MRARRALRRRSALLAVAVVAVLTACSSATTGEDASEPRAETSPGGAVTAPSAESDQPAVGGVEGQALPDVLDFTATEISGEQFAGADVAGTDTVFWFWAPWCTVCARSASDVAATAKSSPDVTFVGVAGLSSDAEGMRRFVDQNGVSDLRHVADTDGSVYTRFGISQQHSFVLVSAEGEVDSVTAYGSDIDLDGLVKETFG